MGTSYYAEVSHMNKHELLAEMAVSSEEVKIIYNLMDDELIYTS